MFVLLHVPLLLPHCSVRSPHLAKFGRGAATYSTIIVRGRYIVVSREVSVSFPLEHTVLCSCTSFCTWALKVIPVQISYWMLLGGWRKLVFQNNL